MVFQSDSDPPDLNGVTKVSGAHLNLEMEVPLTMGSTPLVASLPVDPNVEKSTPEVPPIGFNTNPDAPSAPPSHIYPTITNDLNPVA